MCYKWHQMKYCLQIMSFRDVKTDEKTVKEKSDQSKARKLRLKTAFNKNVANRETRQNQRFNYLANTVCVRDVCIEIRCA